MAQKVKEQKLRLASFVDTVTDGQFLMTQYSKNLTDTEKTPPQVVQNYLTIKRQFKQVTELGLFKQMVKLQSDAPKQLSTIHDK